MVHVDDSALGSGTAGWWFAEWASWKPSQKGTTLQHAKKCIVGHEESGHDFSRAESVAK
jgi:hypothetical protein